VLRWRDRFTSIPLEIVIAVIEAQESYVLIDGAPLPTVRPLLSPGRHVLTVVAGGVEPSRFAFLLWAWSPDGGDDPLLWTPGPPGTWSATGSDPDADAAQWLPCPPGQIEQSKNTPYSVTRALRLGAQPLTIDASLTGAASTGTVWLRASFEMPEAR
jgi:hypothetical protein